MDFVIIYLITLMMENLVIKSSWLVKKSFLVEMQMFVLPFLRSKMAFSSGVPIIKRSNRWGSIVQSEN